MIAPLPNLVTNFSPCGECLSVVITEDVRTMQPSRGIRRLHLLKKPPLMIIFPKMVIGPSERAVVVYVQHALAAVH